MEFYPIEIARSDSDGVWVAGLPDTANIITLGQGYVQVGDEVDAVVRRFGHRRWPRNCPNERAIDAAIGRTRTVLIAFLVIVIAGIFSYRGMPKENEPDISFPFINVEVTLEGVAPEDAERLLVRPLEQELRTSRA